jgi:hypothetical protein
MPMNTDAGAWSPDPQREETPFEAGLAHHPETTWDEVAEPTQASRDREAHAQDEWAEMQPGGPLWNPATGTAYSRKEAGQIVAEARLEEAIAARRERGDPIDPELEAGG